MILGLTVLGFLLSSGNLSGMDLSQRCDYQSVDDLCVAFEQKAGEKHALNLRILATASKYYAKLPKKPGNSDGTQSSAITHMSNAMEKANTAKIALIAGVRGEHISVAAAHENLSRGFDAIDNALDAAIMNYKESSEGDETGPSTI